ncbi:gliding motility ABC transporter [Leptospira wolffii]|uniref:Gliding motility ABC transporter n=1 Tax=Leptospira wolffii TaxID=409998 RepID=A0A2M9ZDD5_9LEPT|nr:GldG family protein [Leptospira wolffii]PJZ66419.1 gliding motility ABC transporter [Leptospira wolffii]
MRELFAPLFEISNKPWFIFANGILLLLLLNGIVSTGRCRADLSRSGRFGLTESSQKVFSDLDSVLYIDAYYSSRIPSEYSSRLEISKGLLQEMAAIGGEKVALRFHHPDESPEAARKAQEAGIEPQILERSSRDSASVKQVYLGISLTLGNRNEVLSLAFLPEQIEYQVLSSVRKMSRGDRDSGIAVLRTSGSLTLSESSPPKDRAGIFIRQVLSSEYGPVLEIDLEKDPIPSEVDLVFWIGAGSLSDTATLKLDRFLLDGGNLIVLAESMQFQMESSGSGFGLLAGEMGAGLAQRNPNASDMIRILEHYGIRIHSDIVLDPDESLPMGAVIELEPGILGRYPYPPWIVTSRKTESLNSSSPYTKDQENLLLPWTSSLEILSEKQKNVKYEVLAKSGTEAESRAEPISLGEKQLQSVPIRANGGPFSLAVIGEGRFRSYFSDPQIRSQKGTLLDTPESKTSRLLVIGTPYLVSDLLAYPDFRDILRNSNIPFFLNMIDLMRGEDDLVLARTKDSAILNLKDLPFGLETGISLFNVFVIPLLLGLYGFRRLRSRSLSQ